MFLRMAIEMFVWSMKIMLLITVWSMAFMAWFGIAAIAFSAWCFAALTARSQHTRIPPLKIKAFRVPRMRF